MIAHSLLRFSNATQCKTISLAKVGTSLVSKKFITETLKSVIQCWTLSLAKIETPLASNKVIMDTLKNVIQCWTIWLAEIETPLASIKVIRETWLTARQCQTISPEQIKNLPSHQRHNSAMWNAQAPVPAGKHASPMKKKYTDLHYKSSRSQWAKMP